MIRNAQIGLLLLLLTAVLGCAHASFVGCPSANEAMEKVRYVASKDWATTGAGPFAEKFPGSFDTGCTMDLECKAGSANLELVDHARVIHGQCECCTILYFIDAPTSRGGAGVLHAFVLHTLLRDETAARSFIGKALAVFAQQDGDSALMPGEDYAWRDTPRAGVITFASAKLDRAPSAYHVLLYVSRESAPPN